MSPTVPTVYSLIPSLPDDDDVTSSPQAQPKGSDPSKMASSSGHTPTAKDPDIADVERALPPGPEAERFTPYGPQRLNFRHIYQKNFKPPNFASRAAGITYIAFCYSFIFYLLAPENVPEPARFPLWIFIAYLMAILKLFLWDRNASLVWVCGQFLGTIPLCLAVVNFMHRRGWGCV
ncbi:hypothetical protein TWF506_007252 [Arthrobotrys conoides]|uniref:Uncharacterized protein n=1 Tax=Arthrobotrys conoides TaxID=74498 RepID=A0AAN8RXW0_9PEZI